MRKEPYDVGSYVHVVNRGTRGLPIVRDDKDRRRFVLMLRHFNDKFYPDNWFRDLISEDLLNSFKRPTSWPAQEKIVEILCFCLVENHLHLLLKEIVAGGIAMFMKRLGAGMTNHFNEKYSEKGSLFLGSYRSRTVDIDEYLQYVSAYIQLKNCFELFPGGYKKACLNYDQAFEWAKKYPYCSLGEFLGASEKLVTNPEILSDIFTPMEYQEFCRDFIVGRSGDGIDDLIVFE